MPAVEPGDKVGLLVPSLTTLTDADKQQTKPKPIPIILL
jgi:hypothetical protein